jgi:multidrug resistance efflux pump
MPVKTVTAELQQLSELHQQGALSNEEFQAAKKKVLQATANHSEL